MISTAIEHKLRSQGKSNPVLVLTGPTIAPEVARGVVTSALVACDDDSVAKKIAQRLSTKTLILSSADDPVGAELWGAYKNTVALACGIVDGLRDSIGGTTSRLLLFNQVSMRGERSYRRWERARILHSVQQGWGTCM